MSYRKFYPYIALLVLFFTGGSLRAEVVYSQAADLFHIADQVSMWHPSMQTQFRDHWQTRFNFQQIDKRWFDGFANIRRKHLPAQSLGDSPSAFFSQQEFAGGPLVEAFFTSLTLEQALVKTKGFLSRDEQKYLEDFFAHYKARFEELTKESSHFQTKIKDINEELKALRFDAYIKRIEEYLEIKQDPNQMVSKRSYLVWWPSQSRPDLAQVGPYVLLRYHPLSHFPQFNTDIVFQGAMRMLVRQLTQEQRVNIAQVFQLKCKLPEFLQGPQALELPLVLSFSRVSVAEEREKKNFVLAQEWSVHPWVNAYVKLIYPEIRRALGTRETFAQESLGRVAQMCHELLLWSEFAQKQQTP